MGINYRRTAWRVLVRWALTICLIIAALSCGFASAASVAEIVDQVSTESYTNYLRNDLYAHYWDERCFGPQHDLAQQRIKELFESFGLETSLHPFEYEATTCYNVVGVHRGISCPDEMYVLGAHYDSVAGSPGALDNGSGVAGLLESARVLSQHAFEGTIVFIAFDREEQGLVGSRAYANDHMGDHIHGMLNLDCIAWQACGPEHPDYNKIRLSCQPGPPELTRLLDVLTTAVESYTELTGMATSGFLAGDSRSFASVGFAAVWFEPYRWWWNGVWHTSQDAVGQPDRIDYDLGTRVTQAAVACLATLAMLAPARIYPDFDGDGDVDVEDCVLLIEHWGTDSQFDIAPPPNGDSIVNDQDLDALLHYWLSDRSSWCDFERRANAGNPVPGDGAPDVWRDKTLTWDPGYFAQSHDVYLGTVFNDVNDASRDNPMDVLVSRGQAGTTYEAPAVFEYSQTYYWRIDEVNGAPDNTIFKGDVWSFTIEPFAYPVENIIATSNATSDADFELDRTVDGSGLNADDQHSTVADDMWLSGPSSADPVYIQYEFNRVYKLYEMLVWNHNSMFELLLGLGIKDVTVEYSANGADWTVLGDVQFAQATSKSDYAANTTVDFAGVPARFVKVTVNSAYGMTGQVGLSEVRFMFIPAHAREPTPTSGAVDVSISTALAWRPGREAISHRLYFSTDRQAVVDGTALVDTVTENSYLPGPLDPGQTYYWKVNEVTETEAISVWEGDVWEFTTACLDAGFS